MIQVRPLRNLMGRTIYTREEMFDARRMDGETQDAYRARMKERKKFLKQKAQGVYVVKNKVKAKPNEQKKGN